MNYYQTKKLLFEEASMEKFTSAIELKNYHSYTNQYVLDALWYERRFWKKHTPVFVYAPCGCGKTTFMEDYAAKLPKDKFLIVSNRIALNTQVKKRLCVKLGEEHLLEELTQLGLENLREIGNVTIVTYQELAFKDEDALNEYSVVLADEVHGLHDDSTFFPRSSKALNKIVNIRHAIRIYFTATPDNIFPEILEREKLAGYSLLYEHLGYHNPVTPLYYEFVMDERTYDDVFFFEDFLDLERLINTKDDESSLIFVETIEEGENIKRIIQSWGKTVALVSSRSKRGGQGFDEYSAVVNTESYTVQYLISTKIFQEGINVRMKNLRNIVMLTRHTKDSLIQCIGRYRMMSSTQKVTVYIKSLSDEEIEDQIKKWRHSLEKIEAIQKMGIKQKDFVIETMDREYKNLFYSVKGKLHTNPLAVDYLKSQIGQYEMLLSMMNEEPYIADCLVLRWVAPEKTLTSDLYVATRVERMEGIHQMAMLLEKHTGLSLKDDQKEKFREDFTELWNTLEGDNQNKLGAKLINQKLNKLQIDYRVRTDRGVWYVEKCKEEQDNG